jgi:hypothetical protein
MSPDVEAKMLADHPEQRKLRGHVEFWNFLPPDELDELLRLFQRVTKKTLVISRTLGIEGRMLLTPDDVFDPVKELNKQCDGTITDGEALRLEYNALLVSHPEIAAALNDMPLKAFSGKAGIKPDTRAIFFCFRIPRPDNNLIDTESGEPRWSDPAGSTVWACYDTTGKKILTEPGAIASLIRSAPDTPRACKIDQATLSEVRKQVEKQIVVEYLKPLQAPIGVSPILKCWMEIS